MHRIIAIAKKESKHAWRDKRMLSIFILFPLFLLVLFGYAVDFDVKNIKLAILDKDNSSESRAFINSFINSNTFQLTDYIQNDNEIKPLLDNKKAQVVMVIPPKMAYRLENKEEVKIQFLVDGVDGNTASIISGYVSAATRNYSQKLTDEVLLRKGIHFNQPVEMQPRFWFNPDLKSTRFLIPGLIAMILIIVAVISTALSIVREKERNTIEQIYISPTTSIEMIIGKTIPYIVISFILALLILTAGYFLFDISVKGSYILLFVSLLVFIISAISLGIFISSLADSQQVAFQVAVFASMLPSVILSGFIFPIENMPFLVQLLTNITPVKFFLVILRAILLKGVGFEAFWDQFLYLILFIFIFLGFASFIDKKKRIA